MIKININHTFSSGNESIRNEMNEAKTALSTLQACTGKGSEFTGWLKLPSSITTQTLREIEQTAANIRANSDVAVIVGIGGSYLGAKAVIEALRPVFDKTLPEILYAGHHLDADYYEQLLVYLSNKKWSIIVISKSGTTTEPAVAFRLLRKAHIKQFGESESNARIYAVTDAAKGALKQLANQNDIKTFVIPDDIGGRYSVLTPVGLLPIAVAGIDIHALVAGAADAEKTLNNSTDDNTALVYAATRNKLYKTGKKVEMLVNYHPQLTCFAEWWKQLYGESEGKEHKGIFVAGATFTTDLHSLGQYIQEGERILFETLLSIDKTNANIKIETDIDDMDKLNYLAGKSIHEINRTASTATLLAHTGGGVPNIVIELEKIDAHNIGQLIYFFELACGISGYVLGINPFDQPGVEAYKINMFALLGKAGYEQQKEELEKY